LLALAPLPEDPVGIARLEALRTEIARAAALDRAGELERALAIARDATVKAESLAYKPAVADALYARGHVEATLHLPAYRTSYEAAIVAAAASGHREVEARSLAALAIHLDGSSADGKLARAYAGHAVAIAEAIPGNPLLQAQTLFANAQVHIGFDHVAFLENVHHGQARLDAAAAYDRDAAELLRISFEELLVNVEPIASTALPKLAALLARSEKIYGPDHPALADTLETMVSYAVDNQQFAEAREHAARIAKLLARYPGRETAMKRIEAHLEADPMRRRRMREEIVDETELRAGPFSPKFAHALSELAEELLSEGVYREAAPIIDRAIQIWDATYAANHEFLVIALVSKAQIYTELGDLETATAAADRATAIAANNNVREMIAVLAALLLADLHFQQRRYAASYALLDKSGPTLRRVLGDDPSLVLLDFYLAACEWELGRGDKPTLMTRARIARDTYAASFAPEQAPLAVMARWFALHRADAAR
jgi:eukaryotic-like serine/threonine-protein kinase